MGALEHPRLVWRWMLAWRFETLSPTPNFRRNVYQTFKPVLVYYKDKLPSDAAYFHDHILSDASDTNHHRHGQAVEGFEQLVQWFSDPGQTICDPFLGGGTTGVAALANRRRFVGCDIDQRAIEATRRRLTDER